MTSHAQLIIRLKQMPRQGKTSIQILTEQINNVYDAFKEGGKDVIRASAFNELSDLAIGTYEKLNVLEQRNRAVAEGFKVSTLRAAQLSQGFDKLGVTLGVNTDKLKQYAVELKALFPGQAAYLANAGKFGTKVAEQSAFLRNNLKLSAEQVVQFTKNQTLMVGASAKSYEQMQIDIADYSKTLRGEYEGAYTDIIESIADLDAETAAVFGKSGTKNLAAAALQAKKLGLELNKVLQVGDNFLDVESAIASELNLQLLGAKDLNVAKIQEARLQGNALALTEQLNTFIKSNAEQLKQNPYLLQEAASAFGMQKSEILGAVAAQEANSKLSEELVAAQNAIVAKQQASSKLSGEQVDQLTEQQKIEKLIAAETEKRRAAGKLKSTETMSILEQEQYLAERRSIAEQKQDQIQQQYADSIDKAGDQVTQINSLIGNLDKATNSALGSVDTLVTAMNQSEFIKALMGIGGAFSTFAKIAENMMSGKMSTVGPGEQSQTTKTGDLFIPGDGSNVITGAYGSFQTTPGDDILAAPNIRDAVGSTDTRALIAALSKMSFHVTNVFDGDKIKSQLEIRQGQTINNINNIA
jgi:hypothetical protein